jgi:hypothetical protein
MVRSVAETLVYQFDRAHGWVLAAVADLTEEQLYARPDGTNSIAWNLWHVARFAEVVRVDLTSDDGPIARQLGSWRQIWHADELAARWELDPAHLGRWETGWGMPEEVAHGLRPPRAELLDYAERAIGAGRAAVALIDDTNLTHQFVSPFGGSEQAYHTIAAIHAGHSVRHLGMMESVKGQLTGRGTATA